jgi:purine-nucleoside phosphorylase
MTPHNEAKRGDFAETVLLPGDPQRARWIAENFLGGARCVNNVRDEPGFTGTFRGVPVSVQSTGMGLPSLAIYVHELLDAYRVKTLIRVGTCGGLSETLKLRSLVISQAASGDSNVNRQLFAPFEYAPCADFGLLRLAADRAAALGVEHVVARTASSDVFYHPEEVGKRYARLRQHGIVAVDMETSAFYTLAARFSARALSICTVVDNMITAEETDHSERQELFRPMVELALEVVVADAAGKTGA